MSGFGNGSIGTEDNEFDSPWYNDFEDDDEKNRHNERRQKKAEKKKKRDKYKDNEEGDYR